VAIGGWRCLRDGADAGAVLCVDFTLAKVRAQANFADLAPRLPGDRAVWGSDETGWPVAAGDIRMQLERWLSDAAAIGDARAVMGFCAGASLAGALARAARRRPAVVLFDPVTVGPRTMLDQYAAAASRMGGAAAVPDPAGHDPGGHDPGGLEPGGHDLGGLEPGALAAELAERYAVAARAACRAQGVPEPIAEQLCRRVAANLRFLALCATAGLSDAPDLVVLSRVHEVPAVLRGAPQVRLDVSQQELLASPDAALAAGPVLAGAHDAAAAHP
jgi:hypothetical protein